MSTRGASTIAAELIAESEPRSVRRWLSVLTSNEGTQGAQAARVIDELVQQQPALLVPHIRELAMVLERGSARAQGAAAHALRALVALAPAKVARHLDRLRQAFDGADEATKDGIVLTFSALCSASIAYQRRVVDVLERALTSAEPRTLQRWSAEVLPTLKGEPYAQARAVIEARLPDLPRPIAQKVATQLGIRLRPP